MKKHFSLRSGFLILCALVSASCVSAKYSYHSVYKLEGCTQVPTRATVGEALLHRGYVHFSEVKGPFDVFHRADIIKKGALAVEPYEDKAGDIAVAVCAGGAENYLLTEEWTSCKDHKDCTVENQKDLKKLAEDWGCRVSERAGHSERWKLEDRQDWTKETCSSIATKLTL